MRDDGVGGPQALIESDFTEEGGLERAIELVTDGGGIAKARDLARSQAELVRPCAHTKRTHSRHSSRLPDAAAGGLHYTESMAYQLRRM